jgi:hypothetical protein
MASGPALMFFVVHHRIGSLLPIPGHRPEYAQLYMYDTEHKVSNRLAALSSDRDSTPDPALVASLIEMLNEHIPLVRQFRMARDRLMSPTAPDVCIRLHGSRFSLPAIPELAALLVTDLTTTAHALDVVVEARAGHCKQMHYRVAEPNPVLCSGRLSQQYVVNAFSCVEGDRLSYFVHNQDSLRMETYQGITDAVGHGAWSGKEVGVKKVLPASHIGGKRYMNQNFHDCMAICCAYGPPDKFTTMTCNPKWPEIMEAIRWEL